MRLKHCFRAYTRLRYLLYFCVHIIKAMSKRVYLDNAASSQRPQQVSVSHLAVVDLCGRLDGVDHAEAGTEEVGVPVKAVELGHH